ncbi:MAG: hypothetical protein HC876_11475 [Chloroflexaceae bacterium]|nr:hypothetical protein [Chloroflexaceae bacterium]
MHYVSTLCCCLLLLLAACAPSATFSTAPTAAAVGIVVTPAVTSTPAPELPAPRVEQLSTSTLYASMLPARLEASGVNLGRIRTAALQAPMVVVCRLWLSYCRPMQQC